MRITHANALVACLSAALVAATAGEAAAQIGIGIGIGPRGGIGYGPGIGYYPGRYGIGPGFPYGVGGVGPGGRYGYGVGGAFGYGSSYYGPGYGGRPPIGVYDTSPAYNSTQAYGLRGTRYMDQYYSNPAFALPPRTLGTPAPAAPQPAPTTAEVTILVPVADAEVRFGDQPMSAFAGRTTRVFRSPPLAEGKVFEYVLTASWTGPDGRPVRKTRTVDVSAGQAVTVDFGTGPADEAAVPQPPRPEPESSE